MDRLLQDDKDLSDPELLSYLIDALRELADVRQREGKWDEGHSYLQTALQALDGRALPHAAQRRRVILERMAWGLFCKGDLDEALRTARSAVVDLDVDKARTDAVILANLYNTLGGIAWQQGNHEEAITSVERSLMLYQQVGYTWGVANAHTNLGVLHYTLGNWREAVQNLEAAGVLRDAVGDLQNMAVNLNNLGFIRTVLGEFVQAEEDLRKSLETRIQLGDAWGEVRTRVNLAHLAVSLGDLEGAKAWLAPALEKVQTDGYEVLELSVRVMHAQILEQEGRLEAGLAEIDRALALLAAHPDSEAAVDCYRILGILQLEHGEYVQAELSLRRSIALAEDRKEPYNAGLARLQLARLYIHQMHIDLAAQTEWRLKAQETLDIAMQTLRRLGAVPILQEADALRQELVRSLAADMAALQVQDSETAPPPPIEAPEGERLSLVLLWIHFDLEEAEDPEEAFAFLSYVAPTVQTLAQEHEAHWLRRVDGFLLVFGAPLAHENDALRALRAAWQLRAWLQEAQTSGPIYPMRMAVALGPGVAGEIGPVDHRTFTVQGDVVDEAAALVACTPPGCIWVTDAVRQSTMTRAEHAPIPHQLPGGSAWQVNGVDLSEQIGPRMHGSKTQLIGRQANLQSMERLAEVFQEKRGGVIWLRGEAGIGKSRLMDEFGIQMRAQGHRVAWGQCSPHTQSRPFSLFTNLLYNVFQIQPGRTPDVVRSQLQNALQQMTTSVQVVSPFLEMLLGVQTPGSMVHIANLEPEQLRQQIFVTLRTLLRGLAGQQPLVLMLDDLHWIDPMSAHLLVFLAAMIEQEPILFVCAQRPEETDTTAWIWAQINNLDPTHTLHLQLTRLSPEESRELLAALLGGGHLSPALERTVLERCDGSPFYIQEFVRMLIERELLRQVDGQWIAPPEVDLSATPLPISLEGLIRSRLNALPSAQRQLLQCISVIGRPCDRSLLAAIGTLTDLEANLAALVQRDILHYFTETQQWQVSHPLIEEVVYRSMLRPQREAWHLRVADALNRRSAETGEDAVEEQAHHYLEANRPLQALPYLVLAGEKAAARFANQEARQSLEQAWRLVQEHPGQTERLIWRISAALGDVLQRLGDYSGAVQVLRQGLGQCRAAKLPNYLLAGLLRRLGDTAHKQGDMDGAARYLEQALTLVQDSRSRATQAERARIHLSLAWGDFMQGDLERAEKICLEGREQAQAIGNLVEVARAENLLGGIYYQQGNLDKAQEHTIRAMALREQIGFTWGVAATASNLGILAYMAGQWRNARRYFERSLALREEFGDVEGVVIVLNNLAWLLKDQGDLEQAQAYYRQSLHLANRIQGQYHMVTAQIGLAQVWLLQEKFTDAHALNQEAQENAAGLGAHDLVAESQRVEADILLAEGKLDAARACAHQALRLTQEAGNRTLESAAWCTVAACALAQEDWTAAEEAVTQARLALEAAENPLEKGRVALLAARTLLRDQVPGAEIPPAVLTQLHEARRIFSDLGATRDLAQVDALLPLRIRAQELFRRLQAAE